VTACTSVSRVMTGGEPLSPALIDRFSHALPHATLYHMYGPTETTVAVTGRRYTRDDREHANQIGAPRANTRVYVLDGAMEPAPVLVAGELFIGGVQVARGYAGRPALTAERFVADPFSGRAGGRMYRSGDMGRWLADGTLAFLGRDDDQVKVRGNRVELREIAARLMEHPAVRDAVVLAREDVPGDQQLAAYWIGDAAIEPGALRALLANVLPDYMVPAAYVRLAALPVTPNGKLDRRALPAPGPDAYVVRDYEAPEGETETALAAMWADVLGVPRVGRHDHFFERGGHSLLAARLLMRINTHTGANLALRDIFEAPVLAQLAARVLHAQLAQFDPAELAALTQNSDAVL
jgi:hypothetical protein